MSIQSFVIKASRVTITKAVHIKLENVIFILLGLLAIAVSDSVEHLLGLALLLTEDKLLFEDQ